MRKLLTISYIVVFLTVFAFLLPQTFAADPAAKTNKKHMIQDVSLHKGGIFAGRFLDANSLPMTAADVSLLQNGKPVAKTKTNNQGKFMFSGLRGGVYQLIAADTQRLYRLWAPGTAPQTARQMANVVADQAVVRGQHTRGRLARLARLTRSPVGLAAIATTAVAVPVALHNCDRDSSD